MECSYSLTRDMYKHSNIFKLVFTKKNRYKNFILKNKLFSNENKKDSSSVSELHSNNILNTSVLLLYYSWHLYKMYILLLLLDFPGFENVSFICYTSGHNGVVDVALQLEILCLKPSLLLYDGLASSNVCCIS